MRIKRGEKEKENIEGGSNLCFPILSPLRVYLCGVGWGGVGWWAPVAEGLTASTLFPIWVPSGLTMGWGSCHVMAWWLRHPLFTDMAATFFIHITHVCTWGKQGLLRLYNSRKTVQLTSGQVGTRRDPPDCPESEPLPAGLLPSPYA